MLLIPQTNSDIVLLLLIENVCQKLLFQLIISKYFLKKNTNIKQLYLALFTGRFIHLIFLLITKVGNMTEWTAWDQYSEGQVNI